MTSHTPTTKVRISDRKVGASWSIEGRTLKQDRGVAFGYRAHNPEAK